MEAIKFYVGMICLALAATGCTSDGSHQLNDPVKPPKKQSDIGAALWKPGEFNSPSTFANQCEKPRAGKDPLTGELFPDRQGTAMHEKMWLRSITDSVYLWYDEIADVNPASYSVLEYFEEVLKADGDRFHYVIPYDDFVAATEEGVSVDYGILWSVVDEAGGYAAYVQTVEASAPAATTVGRGDKVLEIDGIEVVDMDFSELLAALYPEVSEETHTFKFVKRNSNTVIDTTLETGPIVYRSVPQVKVQDTSQGRIGYIEFYAHDMTAESALIDAVSQLQEEGIDELFVDLRYNGGGRLDTASQFAYMVAGPEQTAGRDFERLQFNDKHGTQDPFTNTTDPVPFISSTIVATAAEPLPSLDLNRVFVLTGPDTCSASESFINGLRGIDVEVIQIGDTTCGKPYGFRPLPNCGNVYYTVMFTGANDKGFGEFVSGFSPADFAEGDEGSILPGCFALDDLNHDLGSVEERLFATGLHFLESGECPDTGVMSTQKSIPLDLQQSIPGVPALKVL